MGSFKNKSKRRVFTARADVKGLSITSLLDILTIILVFLIKNVSMESQAFSEPKNMRLPTTTTNEKLIEDGGATVVKIYVDRVELGVEGTPFGTINELASNEVKRKQLAQYLDIEASKIVAMGLNNKPCLVIQADDRVPCEYIQVILQAALSKGFENIYFSSIEKTDWLKDYAKNL